MSSITNLRNEQSHNATDLTSTLQTVELNIIEVCNRTCSFCPRGTPLYKNTNNKMTIEVIRAIATSLQEMNYTNRISFVGFGEPLLHKQLPQFINEISKNVSAKWIEIITNGDYITYDKVKELSDAGCTHLTVSMYDSDISTSVSNMLSTLPIVLTFKHLYHSFDTLVNRTEILENIQILDINKPCYLPFYKMLIDWNGDVVLCNNDWARSVLFGNVTSESISDIWLGKQLNYYRQHLKNGDRKLLNPCNRCNINGTLYGKDSFNLFLNL